MKARFFAAAVSALLAACSGGGQTLVPSNDTATQAQSEVREFTSLSAFAAQNNVTGETVRVFPTRNVIDALRASQAGRRALQSGGSLVYHGGPVQTNPKIYVVFWGAAWNGTGDPNGVAARLKGFLRIVGGSGWLNTVTQYTQSDGQHVGNQPGSFVGSYVDTTSAPPPKPTQTQLAAEAVKAAAHYGDYTVNASYVVALPHGIVPSASARSTASTTLRRPRPAAPSRGRTIRICPTRARRAARAPSTTRASSTASRSSEAASRPRPRPTPSRAPAGSTPPAAARSPTSAHGPA